MTSYVRAVDRIYGSGTSASASQPGVVFFDSIAFGDREFKLKHEIRVPVSRDEGMFVLEARELPIIAYGDTLEDATKEFQDHFVYLWNSIAQQPDSALTPDAQRTKRTQLGLVAGIAALA